MVAKRRIKQVFALFCNDWHELEYAWFFASLPYMEVIGQMPFLSKHAFFICLFVCFFDFVRTMFDNFELDVSTCWEILI